MAASSSIPCTKPLPPAALTDTAASAQHPVASAGAAQAAAQPSNNQAAIQASASAAARESTPSLGNRAALAAPSTAAANPASAQSAHHADERTAPLLPPGIALPAGIAPRTAIGVLHAPRTAAHQVPRLPPGIHLPGGVASHRSEGVSAAADAGPSAALNSLPALHRGSADLRSAARNVRNGAADAAMRGNTSASLANDASVLASPADTAERTEPHASRFAANRADHAHERHVHLAAAAQSSSLAGDQAQSGVATPESALDIATADRDMPASAVPAEQHSVPLPPSFSAPEAAALDNQGSQDYASLLAALSAPQEFVHAHRRLSEAAQHMQSALPPAQLQQLQQPQLQQLDGHMIHDNDMDVDTTADTETPALATGGCGVVSAANGVRTATNPPAADAAAEQAAEEHARQIAQGAFDAILSSDYASGGPSTSAPAPNINQQPVAAMPGMAAVPELHSASAGGAAPQMLHGEPPLPPTEVLQTSEDALRQATVRV